MVWKTIDLDVKTLVRPNIAIKSSADQQQGVCVGIVGGGPKGLYALERLCCRLMEMPDSNPITIYWFNESIDFGTGPNYQVDQAEYLLINYAIGNIDIWDRSSVNPWITDQPTLTQWVQRYRTGQVEVSPYHFASRALVGRYLLDMLTKVLAVLPDHIQIQFVQAEVNGAGKELNERTSVEFGDKQIILDAVMLCTGHCYENTPVFAAEGILDRYIAKPYPTAQFSSIPNGSKVAVVGLGLTFVDVCLALTAGRSDVDSCPTIYPFSSSQIPIFPRPASLASDAVPLRFMDSDWLDYMLHIKSVRQIDFEREILPVLKAEMQYAYYSVTLQTYDADRVRAYIEALAPEKLFGWDDLFYPSVQSKEDPHTNQVALIRYLLAEADKGVKKSPLMAAAAVWRSALPVVGALYEHAGFTPSSHAVFDQQWIGNFNRTAFGPPIVNMKKILTLAEDNILRFDLCGHQVQLSAQSGKRWILRSAAYEADVDFVIDARIGRPVMRQEQHGLYGQLYRSGLIQPMCNGGYQLGCPTMDQHGGADWDHERSPLYFYGTCTEGNFLDNDTLSRMRNDTTHHWVDYIIEKLKIHSKNADINTY